MKKLSLFASIFLMAAAARAAVPQLINFQGQLTDPDGKAVTTAKPVEFRIYDSATNNNTPLYIESQTVTPDSEGNYSVFIGTVTSLSGVNFNQSLWLQLNVAGEALMPRYPLVSVPYALLAATATAVTDSSITDAKIVGVDASKISGTFSSLTVGTGGTAITKHLSATDTTNFGATAAQTCEEATITVTGAAVADTVSLGIPASLANSDAGVPQTFFGFVAASGDAVIVRRCNLSPTTALSGVPGAVVRVDVWKH